MSKNFDQPTSYDENGNARWDYANSYNDFDAPTGYDENGNAIWDYDDDEDDNPTPFYLR